MSQLQGDVHVKTSGLSDASISSRLHGDEVHALHYVCPFPLSLKLAGQTTHGASYEE